jgi:hypothetical protein
MSNFHTDEGPPCPVTGRDDMIDDCYITIEFGYGSDKDMMTYKFGDKRSAVHDVVGKKVLEAIQSLMIEGKSVEDFGENTMEELFDKDWSPSKHQRAEWGFDVE